MFVAGNEKHGVDVVVGGLPIKKRLSMRGIQSPATSSSQGTNLPSDDPDSGSKQVSSSSNVCEQVAPLTHLGGDSIVKERVNVAMKKECLDAFSDHVDREVAVITDRGIGKLNFSMLDNHYAQLQVGGRERVIPGDEGSSIGKLVETDMPTNSGGLGNVEAQLGISAAFRVFNDQEYQKLTLVKQEKVDTHNEDVALGEKLSNSRSFGGYVESRVDSVHASVSRSNWDLNTPMHTWEGSCEDQATNNRTIGLDGLGPDKGGIVKKKLDPGPELLLCREPNETNSRHERFLSKENDVRLELSNMSMLENKHQNPDACLDLQLNQGSTYSSGSCLSMKPTVSFLDLKLATCRDVKHYEDCRGKDLGKYVIGTESFGSFRHIKSEPCEGNVLEFPEAATSDVQTSCSTAAKPEKSDDVSQQFLRYSKAIFFNMESEVWTLKPQGKSMRFSREYANIKLDLISEDPNEGSSKLQNEPMVPRDPNYCDERAGKAVGFGSEVPILCKDELQLECQMPTGSAITQDREECSHNFSSLVFRNPIVESPEPFSSEGTQSELSDGIKYEDADGTSQAIAKVDSLDDCNGNLLRVDPATELHKGSREASKLVVGGNIGDLVDSGEILQKNSDRALNFCHDVDDLVDASSQQDEHDNDLPGPVLGLCGGVLEEKALGMVDADVERPVDIGISMPSHADQEVNKVEKPIGSKSVHQNADSGDHSHSAKNDPVICTTKLLESLDSALAAARLGKKRFPKPKYKVPQEHLKADKGLEKRVIHGKAVIKGKCKVDSQQESAKSSQPPQAILSHSSRTELPEESDEPKHLNGKCILSQINDLNPTAGKLNDVSGRLKLLENKRRMSMEESSWQDGSHSRESREESLKERYQKLESKRNLDNHRGEHGSDMIRRGADRRFNASQGARDIAPEVERVTCSTGFRSARSAYAPDKPLGNFVWLPRNARKDELQQMSSMPFRRWSPPVREQMPVGKMVRSPIRDFNLRRRMDRDFDFLSHEEDFVRNFSGDCVDNVTIPRSNRQREHVNGAVVQRERRSQSPFRDRETAFQTHFYSRSSRRSPDCFQRNPELVCSRSPSINRLDRMISPRQPPRMEEDVQIRRHGRLVEGLPRDLRNCELPRLVKCGQRIIRRRDLVASRDIAEEEFAEPLIHDKFREHAEDNHIVCGRELDKRREHVRSLKHRQNYGEDFRQDFRFHVDEDHPRPFRIFHEADDEFPVGGISVEHDGHIRDRPGTTSQPRCIGEEETYRRSHQQRWHNSGFKDDWPKRRRC